MSSSNNSPSYPRGVAEVKTNDVRKTAMNEQASLSLDHSSDISELAKALCIAQGQLEAASKTSTNPHFKSKYADLSSVWDACRQPLADNKLSVVQLPSAKGPVVTVKTMLLHESGQWISSTLEMTSQKNNPQGIGSAITYARRYALAAMVGITADDDDGNAASQAQRTQRPPAMTQTEATVVAFSKLGVTRTTLEDWLGFKNGLQCELPAPQWQPMHFEQLRDLFTRIQRDPNERQMLLHESSINRAVDNATHSPANATQDATSQKEPEVAPSNDTLNRLNDSFKVDE